MADKICDLRLFVQLVEAGSLTQAALRLNSSLSAMSRRLAALENRLGVRLIDRGTRRFQLTDEGRILHSRALAILMAVDEVEAEVAGHKSEPRGNLRVCAPVHVGREHIAPLVAEFARTHPGMSIELVLSDAEVDVAEDGIDIVLNVGAPQAQSVVARRVLRNRRVVCASTDYLARKGAPETPDDLLAHECILLRRGHKTLDRWKFRENGEVRDVQVRGRLLTTSSEVAYQWTLTGEGIGIKALWDIHRDLASGRLIECLPQYACDDADMYIVYAARQHLPPRMRVFIDFLVAELESFYDATQA